jgi:hypothetical protein
MDIAKVGQEVCIKIENTTGEAPRMFDRHFTAEDLLVSRVCLVVDLDGVYTCVMAFG